MCPHICITPSLSASPSRAARLLENWCIYIGTGLLSKVQHLHSCYWTYYGFGQIMTHTYSGIFGKHHCEQGHPLLPVQTFPLLSSNPLFLSRSLGFWIPPQAAFLQNHRHTSLALASLAQGRIHALNTPAVAEGREGPLRMSADAGPQCGLG